MKFCCGKSGKQRYVSQYHLAAKSRSNKLGDQSVYSTLGRLDAHPDKKVWVGQRQLNGLTELTNLFAQPTNVTVGDFPGILVEHVEHHRVNFSRKDPHDGERRHVQGHARTCKELVGYRFNIVRKQE